MIQNRFSILADRYFKSGTMIIKNHKIKFLKQITLQLSLKLFW